LENCVGNTGSIPRLGIRSLCLQDSPTGVRLTDYNTAFMAGITIASTWDKGALYTRGYNMGKEFKGKGVNIGLLPVCGPLGKSPEAGR
jgi:beta-glucosidase